MDFERRLHRVAQSRIPQKANSGYPAMVVHYLRHPPVLYGSDGRPVFPLSPDPRLIQAAKSLGAVADFVVITANGPHIFQQQIEDAAGKPVLSMVDVTIKEVQARGWRTIGILPFGPSDIYMDKLPPLGLEIRIIDAELQTRLDGAIMGLMEGNSGPEAAAPAREAVAQLRSMAVDGIILACSEIPLLLGEVDDKPDLVNPAQLVAEAAVQLAIS